MNYFEKIIEESRLIIDIENKIRELHLLRESMRDEVTRVRTVVKMDNISFKNTRLKKKRKKAPEVSQEPKTDSVG
jgi:hypothetical protein